MISYKPKLITAVFVLIPTSVVSGMLYFQNLPDYKYEFHNVRVVKLDQWKYWMVPASGDRFYTTVCRDYEPPVFETGMVLTKVIFVDKGSCWSLNPDLHAGYYIKRRPDGWPEIADGKEIQAHETQTAR